jgi:uncharacterized protein YndB with AHSA1/START domain
MKASSAATSRARKTAFVAELGKPTIVITQVFDPPRGLVFEAYTNPGHIPQWWGTRRLTTTVEKMDVRPEGEWRFVQRAPDGKQFGFDGTYCAIVPPERTVATFEFEGMPGESESMERLAELPGAVS